MMADKITLALAMIALMAVVGGLIAILGAFAFDSTHVTLSGAVLVSLSSAAWILWALAFFVAILLRR